MTGNPLADAMITISKLFGESDGIKQAFGQGGNQINLRVQTHSIDGFRGSHFIAGASILLRNSGRSAKKQPASDPSDQAAGSAGQNAQETTRVPFGDKKPTDDVYPLW